MNNVRVRNIDVAEDQREYMRYNLYRPSMTVGICDHDLYAVAHYHDFLSHVFVSGPAPLLRLLFSFVLLLNPSTASCTGF